MESTRPNKTSNQKLVKSAKIAAGIFLVAFLMGIRDEFSELWIRVLLAAMAGASLGLVLWQTQKRSS